MSSRSHSWKRETDIVNRLFTYGAKNKIEASRWYRNSTRKAVVESRGPRTLVMVVGDVLEELLSAGFCSRNS